MKMHGVWNVESSLIWLKLMIPVWVECGGQEIKLYDNEHLLIAYQVSTLCMLFI